MQSWIDGTLYPDRQVPASLDTLADRVDFLVRVCGAWDFGVLPRHETVDEIRRPEWRDAVDACRLLPSPAYHILRQWHGLPPLPFLGRDLAYIRDDPNLSYI
jgi:hypothetical protein